MADPVVKDTSPDDTKNVTQAELNRVVDDIRELVEKKSKKGGDRLDAVDEQKMKNFSEVLDEHEKKNEALTTEIEARKTAEFELKERIEELEKQLSKPNNGGPADEKAKIKELERKAFDKFFRGGEEAKNFEPEELKYLRTDSDVDGGVLATTEYIQEIIKNITEISAMRSVCRVRPVGKGRMEIPVRDSLVSAFWEGEGEETQDSNSQYGLEKIPLHKLMVNVPITLEELQDTSFNMEAEINADVVEAFNQKEGAAFVNGTGNADKQPEGFLNNSRVTSRATGIADGIDMDSIMLLQGDLKKGYNPIYTMNRTTAAKVKILKDGNGQYLWQAGNIAAGVPNQISGDPYLIVPDMDDIGANAFPIAYGDFRQGYLIGDRMALSVIRDPYTLKKSGKVEFTFVRRVGGAVIKPEAIRLLKCAVS